MCPACIPNSVKFPEIDKIFKSPASYKVPLNERVIPNFELFQKSIDEAIILLEQVKNDPNASKLNIWLNNLLLDFQLWMRNYEDFVNTMEEHVKDLMDADKQYLSDKGKMLKKLNGDQMEDFGKLFYTQEKIVAERHNEVLILGELMYKELVDRNFIINEIIERLQDITPETLNSLVADMFIFFSKPTNRVKDIMGIVKWCINYANVSIYMENLDRHLKIKKE